ncbi:MAG TPA: SpoIID/LytB domain-containing protein [Blastocatellia bacterium]|jgi:stage II sporulation protein D|nr:SpoIID/LytB domain-containing protein [Blastocatellia bacterium]
MPVALATIALLSFAATGVDSASRPLRIGLFSLFKPDVLNVQPSPGHTAILNAGRLSEVVVEPGQTIRVRKSGAGLNVVLVDAYGRIKATATAGEAKVEPDGSGGLELNLPARMKRAVRGSLYVGAENRLEPAMLSIVLETDMESAVASIVAAEIAGRRESEAIKALAIVVRTFVQSHLGRHRAEGFDFCDTTHCQLYRGEADLSAEVLTPVVAMAVSSTEGEVLIFQGRAIEGQYTAACGGLSATPEMVWGGRVQSGYPYRRIACQWCRASRYCTWQRTARAQSVLDALASAAPGRRLSQAAEIVAQTEGSSDLVRSISIRDRGRSVELPTDDFRRRLGQRLGWNTVLSPTFSVQRRGNAFVFRGRGFGSQVGLCVAGALAQAVAGRSCRDILSFYYPQTEVTRVG